MTNSSLGILIFGIITNSSNVILDKKKSKREVAKMATDVDEMKSRGKVAM